MWSQRLEEIRAIPSVRETEIASAERDLLASQSARELIEATLTQERREARELRAFVTSAPAQRNAWPMTREDMGVLVSSWRRPVPATAPFLKATLPLLQAAASSRGLVETCEAEVAKLGRRVALLTAAKEKGFAGQSSVSEAQCALDSAEAKAAAERIRVRIRDLELHLFLRLAQSAGVEASEPTASFPADLQTVIAQASNLQTSLDSWIAAVDGAESARGVGTSGL